MKLILPLIGLLLGAGAGAGAGLFLTETPTATDGDEPIAEAMEDAAKDTPSELEIVTLNNQFVIPVVEDDQVGSMAVLSIGMEVEFGLGDQILTREAKMRDIFLQVLFEHANMGGFNGAFTNGRNLSLLRNALLETAVREIGDGVKAILITDLARRDI